MAILFMAIRSGTPARTQVPDRGASELVPRSAASTAQVTGAHSMAASPELWRPNQSLVGDILAGTPIAIFLR